jgi:hypothetical protein
MRLCRCADRADRSRLIYETHAELDVIGWPNVGLFVMRTKKMPFPEPATYRFDIIDGLGVL